MTRSLSAARAWRVPVIEQALLAPFVFALYLLPGRAPGLPLSWHGLLLVPLLLIAAALHKRRMVAPSTWPYWALIAIVLISAAVAGRYGPDVYKPFLFGLMASIAVMAVGRRRDLRTFFWLLLPILVIDASLGMLVRLWPAVPPWLNDVYAGPFARPLHRGAFLMLGTLAAGAAFLHRGRSWLLLPFTILLMAMIMAGLRGLWIGAAVGIVALMLFDRRPRSLVLPALAALSFLAVQEGIRLRVEQTGDLALAVGSAPAPQTPLAQETAPPLSATVGATQAEVEAASFALDFFLKSGAAKFFEELTPAGRLGYWQAGARMTLAHPVLGVGPGNFPREFPKYYRGVRRDAERTSDPHSMYVGVLAELGLVGAIAFLVVLLAAARSVWRHRRSVRARPDVVFAGAGVAALCAIGLTWDIHVQRVWWLALGLFGVAVSDTPVESHPA